MVRTSCIDHILREETGLNLAEYILCDALHQVSHPVPFTGSINKMGEALGISPSLASKSLRTIEASGYVAVVNHNGKPGYQTTADWGIKLHAVIDEPTEGASKHAAKNSKVEVISKEFIAYLNKEIGSQYEVTNTVRDAVRKLIRKDRSLEARHFMSVVWVKVLEWKDDPDMVQYLRPSTLLSNKFFKYLDEARARYNKSKPKTLND